MLHSYTIVAYSSHFAYIPYFLTMVPLHQLLKRMFVVDGLLYISK